MRNKTWIRLLSGLFCVALLICALPMREAHAETALASGFVNTTKLNLRKGAGTGNAILTTLDVNTVVNIYEVTGTWLRIDVPSKGKSGYVSGQYITVDSASLSAYALASTNARVNLRKEATSKSDSLGLLAKSTSLTIYSVDAKTGWYKVKVHSSGKEGYVYPSYVSVVSKVDKASDTTATKGEITASNVNLRSGPGTNYTKLDKLQKLDTVTILDKSGDWYKVTADAINKTGYVYASFVKVTSTSPTPTPGATTPTPIPTATPAGSQAGKLNASGVNFRTGPGTSYSSLGKLDKGTLVTVLSKSGEWYKLTVNSTGKTGYVFAKYITLIAATPTPKPTVTPTVSPTVTPKPATPSPATPTPATPTPATPSPATPSPATPSPATPTPTAPTTPTAP